MIQQLCLSRILARCFSSSSLAAGRRCCWERDRSRSHSGVGVGGVGVSRGGAVIIREKVRAGRDFTWWTAPAATATTATATTKLGRGGEDRSVYNSADTFAATATTSRSVHGDSKGYNSVTMGDQRHVVPGALTAERMTHLRESFLSDPKNRLALNLVSKSDPLEATVSRPAVESGAAHVFSHRVEEAKPMTNQKSSGRCWLFACLNAMRIPFMKSKNLDDFEFSQGHLFFCDKVERCNYFLHSVVEAARKEPKEKPDGRLFSFLLSNPTSDGGQWDMVVNLIKKYGVMPKKCFPEAYSCENSRRLNQLLRTKLREYCCELLTLSDGGATDAELLARISVQMETIYRVTAVCLGVPPSEFVWEFYDKSKKWQRVGPISPVAFYQEQVRPHFDVEEKICLVSDPRPENPVGRLYTVDFLGNVVGGRRTVYNNQTVEVLMDATRKSILEGEAVWFGCDVSKHMASKQGLLDLEVHDHDLVFGTHINRALTKAQRLVYGDSEMNHAMVITGVHLEGDSDEGEEGGDAAAKESKKVATRYRVENSWGEDRNEKGYLRMTSDWFKEFVFEVVVDKKFVPEEVLEVEEEPKILPAWDPMGALARC